MSHPRRRSVLAVIGLGMVGAMLSTPTPTVASTSVAPLPVVSPVPQHIGRAGTDVVVPGRVEVVTGPGTDGPAQRLLVDELRAHGVDRVDVVDSPTGRAVLSVHLGPANRADVASALAQTEVPDRPEGYAVRVDREGAPLGTVALGGADAAGQYYAVQTLRQLFVGSDDDAWRIAGAAVSDFPAMPLRGSIEGFYGKPWSHQERLGQLAFYGDTKANTYIYAPKDDPYHRERWREPYPAGKRQELAELVDQANAHHVRFTFALSPGNTICYSGAGDRAALLEKFESMYAIGVRAYSVPLDDIALRFNCEADRARYGSATQATVGQAQAELLSDVQEEFVETHEGVRPLQTVPTQYGDLAETPYKQSWRAHLHPGVVVMWTGTDVVPTSITVEQTERISQLYGRDVFVWDNYPVNDFGQTAGRLLLAPYDKREPGLSDHVTGIVSNPMNQASASKLAMFTMFDFAWNDRAFNRDRSGHEAAAYLGDRHPATTAALEVFVDLNHAAPTFGSEFWQPQAPRLDATLRDFWAEWGAGEAAAIPDLRPTVDAIAAAPASIRAGVSDPIFLSDTGPWLDATEKWGQAMSSGLDTLAAIRAEDAAAAASARQEMEILTERAKQYRSVPGKNRVEGQVQIGDGVVDAFIADVAAEHDKSLGLAPLVNLSQGRVATQISDWAPAYSAEKSVDGNLYNFSTTSGGEGQPWWQVDLGQPADIESINVYNRVDCCAQRVQDYYVLVSPDPIDGTLTEALADPDVTNAHQSEQAGRPTTVDAVARGRYVRVWLSSTAPTELNMAEVQVFGRSGENAATQ